MCWASNHQNTYRNGPRAHFPFSIPFAWSICLRELSRSVVAAATFWIAWGNMTMCLFHRLGDDGHLSSWRAVTPSPGVVASSPPPHWFSCLLSWGAGYSMRDSGSIVAPREAGWVEVERTPRCAPWYWARPHLGSPRGGNDLSWCWLWGIHD
jgi:hypothetical protein